MPAFPEALRPLSPGPLPGTDRREKRQLRASRRAFFTFMKKLKLFNLSALIRFSLRHGLTRLEELPEPTELGRAD